MHSSQCSIRPMKNGSRYTARSAPLSAWCLSPNISFWPSTSVWVSALPVADMLDAYGQAIFQRRWVLQSRELRRRNSLRGIKLAVGVGSLLSGPRNFMLWAREVVVALIGRFPHLGIQERGNGVARVLRAAH